MKNLVEILNESVLNENAEDKIDAMIEEWEKRMKTPFGKALKKLQKTVRELGIYAGREYTEDGIGLMEYTPFDNYITAFALDNNKEYTYKVIKSICDDWDWTENYDEIKKQLQKLEKLAK